MTPALLASLVAPPAALPRPAPPDPLRGVKEAFLAFAAHPTDGTETLHIAPDGTIRGQRRRRRIGATVPPAITLTAAHMQGYDALLGRLTAELDRLAALGQAWHHPSTRWSCAIIITFADGLPLPDLDIEEPPTAA